MPRTGRPREFDAPEALLKARDLFWTRGYAATSIQDLVDELAVQRGSLYAAFGDKHSLYLKAVAQYIHEGDDELKRLLDAEPLLPALRAALADPIRLIDGKLSTSIASDRGCLVGNTAAELTPRDAEATALVRDGYALTVRTFTTALARAQERGEVTTSATPETQANMLLCLLQGFVLVARTGTDPAPLIAGIESAIDGLQAS